MGTQNKTEFIWLILFLFFFLTLQLAVRAPWGSQHESPLLERQYLEKPGVEKECIGSLCVIFTVQVKVAEFVQVPVWGNMLNHQV